jgi:two-component system, OmpR family, sensor histidine kinase KdpD
MQKILLIRGNVIRVIFRYLGTIAIVGSVTLLLLLARNFLTPQLIALIYLLPVILTNFILGLFPGILASFCAFLAFNFFFIPPYYTFTVLHTQDLITLIIFLIVSVAINQLIGQARQGMEIARSREWEATRMYELTSALSGLKDDHEIALTLGKIVCESFKCHMVEVGIDNRPGNLSFSIVIPEGARQVTQPTLRKPLMTARSVEGQIRLWLPGEGLSPDETPLLDAFVTQGSLALERIRLSKSEARARVFEETDRAKSMLLSSVSHELRSPLASIKASVSSLRSGMVDWDSEARLELLTTIEEESDHLNQLIGNLLDMSRIEAGALKLQRTWNSLSEIAAGVVKRLRGYLKDYQVELDFPADLPLIPSDYVLIEQVFSNLITNSIKFAPKQSIITIRAKKENDFVHVFLANQGPPIAKEDLERIFDKFNRVNISDRVMGTGLGLSICKGIIEAHEGKIWAENISDGLIFHFTLPLKMDGVLPAYPVEETNE